MQQDIVRSLSFEQPNGQYLVDPLSLNYYTYAHNNPIRYKDPSGCVVTDWDRQNVTNQKDLNQLQINTDIWHDSKSTQAQKDAAAASSKAIRAKYMIAGETQLSTGIVQQTAHAFNTRRLTTNPTVPMQNKRDDFVPFTFQFFADDPVGTSLYAGTIYISGVNTELQLVGTQYVTGALGDILEMRLILYDTNGTGRYISPTQALVGTVGTQNRLYGRSFDLTGYNLTGNYYYMYYEKVGGSVGLYVAGYASGQ